MSLSRACRSGRSHAAARSRSPFRGGPAGIRRRERLCSASFQRANADVSPTSAKCHQTTFPAAPQIAPGGARRAKARPPRRRPDRIPRSASAPSIIRSTSTRSSLSSPVASMAADRSAACLARVPHQIVVVRRGALGRPLRDPVGDRARLRPGNSGLRAVARRLHEGRHPATLAACFAGSSPSGTVAARSVHAFIHSRPPTPGFSATTSAIFLAADRGIGLLGNSRKSSSLFGSGGFHASEKASGSTCRSARCGEGAERRAAAVRGAQGRGRGGRCPSPGQRSRPAFLRGRPRRARRRSPQTHRFRCRRRAGWPCRPRTTRPPSRPKRACRYLRQRSSAPTAVPRIRRRRRPPALRAAGASPTAARRRRRRGSIRGSRSGNPSARREPRGGGRTCLGEARARDSSAAPRSSRRVRSAPTPGVQPASTSSSRHMRSSRADDQEFDGEGLRPEPVGTCGLHLPAVHRDPLHVGDVGTPAPASSQRDPEGAKGRRLPRPRRRRRSPDVRATRRRRRTMRKPAAFRPPESERSCPRNLADPASASNNVVSDDSSLGFLSEAISSRAPISNRS